MNVTLAALTRVPALARRNFERTGATADARAGDFEIIADDALAFVKAATIFRAAKIVIISTSLLGIQFEIDFYVVVIALD